MSSIVAAYDKTLYYNEAGKYCVLRLKTADPTRFEQNKEGTQIRLWPACAPFLIT